MNLRYINKSGVAKDIALSDEPIAIGRSRDAGISLLDDRASRVHCGLRYSNGEYYLKDMKSRNGTVVNGIRVEDTVKLTSGDRIQTGSTTFLFEKNTEGDDATLKEVETAIQPDAPAAVTEADQTIVQEVPKPASRPTIKVGSTMKIQPPARKIIIKKPGSTGE